MLGLDSTIHDKQHGWASIAGGIAGVCIFITYYFMTRVESVHSPSKKLPNRTEHNREFQWEMPWWYFVVAIILFGFAGAAVGCTLSVAIRPRTLQIKTK